MSAASIAIFPLAVVAGAAATRLLTTTEIILAQRADAAAMMRFNTPGGAFQPNYAMHADGGLASVVDLVNGGSWTPYIYSTNTHPALAAGQDGQFKLIADNASKGGLLSPAGVTFGNADFTLYGIFEDSTGDAAALIGGNDGTAALSLSYGSGNNTLYIALNGINQVAASAATENALPHCYVWQYTAATKKHQVWIDNVLLINWTAAAAPAMADGRIRLCGQTTSTSGNSISNMMLGATYAAGMFNSANAAIPGLVYAMAKELMPLRAFP